MNSRLLVIGIGTVIAASAQAISGFGMNLILAPLAQVLLPGAAAVRLTAGLGGILNSGLLLTGWRLIVWRSVLCLVAPAVAATLVLGPVISRIGAGPVSVAVAVITVLAIAASVWRTLPERATGAAGALIVGVLSGALNVSSGVSGPPVAVYAAAQPWSPAPLVATVQAVPPSRWHRARFPRPVPGRGARRTAGPRTGPAGRSRPERGGGIPHCRCRPVARFTARPRILRRPQHRPKKEGFRAYHRGMRSRLSRRRLRSP